MNKKNQKIITIAVLTLILIITIVLVLRLKNDPATSDGTAGIITSTTPQFLSEQEKLDMGINTKDQVQIFRDASGDNIVYKIIRTKDDIVSDPATVTAINPPQKLPINE
ncbi:hypothetical protein GW920_03175 [Candidatus Falkowbacteria bacterium]|uniref:Uncharacterized protein n=1 Tax=Candidatus Falkowbacteria bacterium CG10_big_fil_rev_8_21_14_0_10_37_18 TaxID=1974562 RepID=A0A2H0V889_9BACT|nr:hypothetical protein [Candidatus Falkowbacteria bacterium]NCQ12830.1 hypothetical protein [Candidatus Falkowbacteria bacterium]OIO05775.1 MAG: hypothetical protein AUJ26_02440 [Candidatus Falkowbacteria bacterium CG1_02_37_21]PIR95324.1 MAG: hypothetical protein COT93_03180 [Candidatus Falkowbacteria bacterium CG10_big_fil_rev_8_21_14_0_10_37_18]